MLLMHACYVQVFGIHGFGGRQDKLSETTLARAPYDHIYTCAYFLEEGLYISDLAAKHIDVLIDLCGLR